MTAVSGVIFGVNWHDLLAVTSLNCEQIKLIMLALRFDIYCFYRITHKAWLKLNLTSVVILKLDFYQQQNLICAEHHS
jgi:hypothetical protein